MGISKEFIDLLVRKYHINLVIEYLGGGWVEDDFKYCSTDEIVKFYYKKKYGDIYGI